MQLNTEVFPAPFGPMIAWIPPFVTLVETPLIAFTPPNERCKSSILRSDTRKSPPRLSQKKSRNGPPKRTGKNRRALRATPLPLLSPKPLLYYQIMDTGVLIPIAFLLADRKSVV